MCIGNSYDIYICSQYIKYLVATCLMVSTYYYILIYRYVWIYGTVSDVYGVDLFAMPGMKLVVTPLEY